MPLAKLVKRYLSLFIIIHKKAPQLERCRALASAEQRLKFNCLYDLEQMIPLLTQLTNKETIIQSSINSK